MERVIISLAAFVPGSDLDRFPLAMLDALATIPGVVIVGGSVSVEGGTVYGIVPNNEEAEAIITGLSAALGGEPRVIGIFRGPEEEGAA